MRTLPLAAILTALALPATAATPEELQLPPPAYSALTFLHPNGCLYTRADAPGAPRQWFVITNGNAFAAGARPGSDCTSTLTQPDTAGG